MAVPQVGGRFVVEEFGFFVGWRDRVGEQRQAPDPGLDRIDAVRGCASGMVEQLVEWPAALKPAFEVTSAGHQRLAAISAAVGSPIAALECWEPLGYEVVGVRRRLLPLPG